MKYTLTFIFILTISWQLKAQDSLNYKVDWGNFDFKDIYIGFNRTPKVDEGDATYTSIELGYAKSSLSRYIYSASSTVYFGQELGLTQNRQIHGSKVGAWVSANMVAIGLEVAHQTDYQDHTVNIWPSLGLGLYPLKISMAGRVRLTGKGFQPQNKISFNLSYMLFNLSNQKRTPKKTN